MQSGGGDNPTTLPTEAPARQRARNNNFNFLRLVLAALVLLSHSSELLDGNRHRELLTRVFHTYSFGELAVDGFFLLSGFLILQSWEQDPNLWSFLRKRVLRIYPGFIAASLICLWIVGPLGARAGEYFRHLHLAQSAVRTFFLLGPQTPAIFEGTPYPHVNGAMWTILYEFRCYLLVAILGLFGAFRRRNLWLGFSLLVLALFLIPALQHIKSPRAVQAVLGDPATTVRLLGFFSAGTCFYLFRERIRYRGRWALAAVLSLLVALFRFETAHAFLATCGAYLLFCFAFAPIPWLERFKRGPDISYGLYLYGWPVQKLLAWYLPHLTPAALFLLALAGSALCGLASWHLVELPCLRLKTHGARRLPNQDPASRALAAASEAVGPGDEAISSLRPARERT